MIRIVYSPRSRFDIKRIWQYIAKDNERAADRLTNKIKQKIQLLKIMPEMGARRSDIQENLRVLVQGNYLVLYEFLPSTEKVEIVRIIEAMRNISE